MISCLELLLCIFFFFFFSVFNTVTALALWQKWFTFSIMRINYWIWTKLHVSNNIDNVLLRIITWHFFALHGILERLHTFCRQRLVIIQCLQYFYFLYVKEEHRSLVNVTLTEFFSLISDYFTSLSALSQLSTLARQMHSDAANPTSHKYIAHQLALLYVSQKTYLSYVHSPPTCCLIYVSNPIAHKLTEYVTDKIDFDISVFKSLRLQQHNHFIIWSTRKMITVTYLCGSLYMVRFSFVFFFFFFFLLKSCLCFSDSTVENSFKLYQCIHLAVIPLTE